MISVQHWARSATDDSGLFLGLLDFIQSLQYRGPSTSSETHGGSLWNHNNGFSLVPVLSRTSGKACKHQWVILKEEDNATWRTIKHHHRTIAIPTTLYIYNTSEITKNRSIPYHHFADNSQLNKIYLFFLFVFLFDLLETMHNSIA